MIEKKRSHSAPFSLQYCHVKLERLFGIMEATLTKPNPTESTDHREVRKYREVAESYDLVITRFDAVIRTHSVVRRN